MAIIEISFFFSYRRYAGYERREKESFEMKEYPIKSATYIPCRRAIVMRMRASSYYYCNDMFREFIRQDTFATISNRNECNVTVMTGGRLEWGRQNSRTWGWQKPRVQTVFSEGNYVGVALSDYAIARRLTTRGGRDKIDSHD